MSVTVEEFQFGLAQLAKPISRKATHNQRFDASEQSLFNHVCNMPGIR